MLPIEQYVGNFQESKINISSQSHVQESNRQGNSFSRQLEAEFKNPVYKGPEHTLSNTENKYSNIFSSSLSQVPGDNYSRNQSGNTQQVIEPKKRYFSFHEEQQPLKAQSQDACSAEFGQKPSSTIQFGNNLQNNLKKQWEEEKEHQNHTIVEMNRDESSTYQQNNLQQINSSEVFFSHIFQLDKCRTTQLVH